MAATDLTRRRSQARERALHMSGARIVGEFRCGECGYGIVCRLLLPICPMCRGSTWEKVPWRPYTRNAR